MSDRCLLVLLSSMFTCFRRSLRLTNTRSYNIVNNHQCVEYVRQLTPTEFSYRLKQNLCHNCAKPVHRKSECKSSFQWRLVHIGGCTRTLTHLVLQPSPLTSLITVVLYCSDLSALHTILTSHTIVLYKQRVSHCQ